MINDLVLGIRLKRDSLLCEFRAMKEANYSREQSNLAHTYGEEDFTGLSIRFDKLSKELEEVIEIVPGV